MNDLTPAAPPVPVPTTPWWKWPTHVATLAIDALKRIAAGGLFATVSRFAGRLGLMSLIVSSGAIALFLAVAAIRSDSLSMGLSIVAVPVLLCILQFTADRFTDLGESIVRNTPTRASGLALYDLLGLLLLVAGLGLGGLGIYGAVDAGDPRDAVLGILLLLGFGTVGFMFLTPSALNLGINETNSAGEDGLSVIGTFIKAYLAGSRVIFGGCAIIGCLLSTIGAVWWLFDRTDLRPVGYVVAGGMLAAYGALLPLGFYLLSIVYFILVDVLMAIMRMAPTHSR
jgi:hypothetical protein